MVRSDERKLVGVVTLVRESQDVGMQPDDQTRPQDDTQRATSRPPTTALSWLKGPWVILIFGGVMLIAVWVGIGIWTEQRRSAAVTELEKRYSVYLQSDGKPRCPAWLPNWLGQLLPPGWARDDLRILTNVFVCDDDRVLRLLSRIPELEEIAFASDCTFSDDALLELIETHQLKKLTFQVPRSVTPQHLAALRQRGGVDGSLSLRAPFNEQHLFELSQMTGLQTLHLTGPVSTNTALPANDWVALCELTWDDSQLTDAQFATFGVASKLKTLSLKHTRLSSLSGPVFERMPIESLYLESPDIDDVLMESLGRVRPLKELHLPQGQMGDAGLQALAQLPNLYSLRVSVRGLTVSSARSLRDNTSVQFMVFDADASLTDEWVAEVARERFNFMELLNSAITDEGVAAIQKGCPEVFWLSLAGSRVTNRCLPILRQMPALTDVDLSNTAITDVGLKQVELDGGRDGVLPWRMLDLSGTSVTREGALAFLRRTGNAGSGVKLAPNDCVRLPRENDQLPSWRGNG